MIKRPVIRRGSSGTDCFSGRKDWNQMIGYFPYCCSWKLGGSRCFYLKDVKLLGQISDLFRFPASNFLVSPLLWYVEQNQKRVCARKLQEVDRIIETPLKQL